MLQLHARLSGRWDAEPAVLRIATAESVPPASPHDALLMKSPLQELPAGFGAYFATGDWACADSMVAAQGGIQVLPEVLNYLSEGDVVYVQPRTGELWVLYRRLSPFNSMLVTERCNSRCVMCSQPPKDVDDYHLLETFFDAIPLMHPDTPELGITGGEPTLLGQGLLDLIVKCKECLPNTALHMLSNGRLFSYLALCQDLATVGHPDFVIGIPLYSDIASRHDFVVQAQGAFDETIRGIMNLQRCGLRIELRVVLHRQTVDRLSGLARFITRNLPFVEHVALMGLEMMGFVRVNLDALWIDPVDYQQQLTEAVRTLTQHQMTVSIYNHQLCTLDEELWPYARKSISDWKNEYLDVCNLCNVKDQCGGFFASAQLRYSDHIRPVLARADRPFDEVNPL